MIFKRSIQKYGDSPDPVTPYQKAAQVWDKRIGTSQAQAQQWRNLAFVAVSISLILSGGMVWLASQNRITPYVVEVGSEGEVKALGPATSPYNPSDAQIAWFVARFITNIRSLPTDPVLVRQNWLQAYDFATDRAALFLNAQAQAHDPFAGIGEHSVTVEVTNVVRASPTSFQVKWSEQAFDRGTPVSTSHWTAILSIQQMTPHSESVLRKNPLGLYINELAWSQDYGGETRAGPQPSATITAADIPSSAPSPTTPLNP